MNGLSGFALAGYLNDLEREKKRAYGAVDTLNKEMGASDQYQGAKSRTNDWLRSLSPEELSRLNPEVRNLSSNFEGVGDVSRFDTTKRADELGLTSEFAGVDGISDYMKSLGKKKEEKKTADVDSALSDATTGLQRQKKFADLNELEKSVGITPGDYNLQSPREVFTNSGSNKYMDQDRVKEFYKANVEDPEKMELESKKLDQKKSGTGGTAVWSQKKALMEQDPEAIPKLKSQIESLRGKGVLSDISADYFLDRLTTDPVTTAIAIDDYVKKPEIAGKTVEATTDPKVRQKYALVEPTAATTAATTAAGENTKREIQAGNPILSEAQGGALSDSYNAVNYLNTLKSALQNNNLGYFDIDRKTGQFASSEAADAFLQLVEIVGRKRSGAAISDSEWKNFGKQVLNKNNLLTEQGKKTAIEGLDRYLDKFYGAGVTTTGNEDWYNNYKGKSNAARSKAEGNANIDLIRVSEDKRITEANKVHTVTSDDEYNKLPSGSLFKGPDGRTRRKP